MSSALAQPAIDVTQPPPEWTPEMVDALRDGRSYELIDGELVERSMSILAGRVVMQVGRHLLNWLDGNPIADVIDPETTFACFADDPNEARRADVAVIAVERITDDMLTGVVRVAPDLVIEVLSPGDVAYDVNTKVDRWRAAGTRLVWVIDPMTRRVFVFSANAERILGAADELDGEDVLPGFACPVANLFRTSRDRAAAK
ncbi:MAG: Uma2 family endonuclease [Planctomycetota bacterium]